MNSSFVSKMLKLTMTKMDSLTNLRNIYELMIMYITKH